RSRRLQFRPPNFQLPTPNSQLPTSNFQLQTPDFPPRMNLQLSGKSALVLASSGGLGRAMAEQFAAEGASVTLFARREDECRRVAEGIVKAGGVQPEICVGDLTKKGDVERAV